jgi:putative endopeptidase
LKTRISQCAGYFAVIILGLCAMSRDSAAPLAIKSASSAGIDLSAIDKTVSPAADFYKYANGNWLLHAKIPSDQPDWDSFDIIYERNQTILHELANKAAADTTAPADSPEGKVGSFYRSAVDEAHIQADGDTPLKPEFAKIDAVTDVPSLMSEIAHLHRLAVSTAFSFGPEQDPADSSSEIASVGQGGLGLPEPSYYTKTDSASAAIRAAYVAYITKIFNYSGEDPNQAAVDAATVLSVETKLALVSKSLDELRDPIANYHRMSLSALEGISPRIDWPSYFDALGLPKPGNIDVNQPAFFTSFGTMLATVPLADWMTYLKFGLVNAEANRLSSNFDSAYFAFFGKLLGGTPMEEVRWKRAVEATDGEIGDALGQLYVKANFPPAAKVRAVALVKNLKATLRADIVTLPWMGASTKQAALIKLDAMAIKVGYPDHWRDYSELDVTSPSYVVNCMRADEFQFQHQLNKIGKPVDRSEWGMTAPTVNAYYDDSLNSINFPAGILLPPFFDPRADDASNYGGIGVIMGHEMTHGFDDTGRLYDSHGNLHNWWSKADLKNFDQRRLGIVNQYSAYVPLPGQHIDGNATIGENIADIGGCKISYLALQKDLNGKPIHLIGGYTPNQRFFLSFAQIYRDIERPAYEAELLRIDVHSPDPYRVKGVLADMPEFHSAFPGAKQNTGSPTIIW